MHGNGQSSGHLLTQSFVLSFLIETYCAAKNWANGALHHLYQEIQSGKDFFRLKARLNF